MTKATPRRPYLLRAMHEWMTDNLQTPHIVVDASADGVEVPPEYIKDGKIILNVSANATQHLRLGNDSVEFEARFEGIPFDVQIPVRAVLGIYARETGQGMIFTDDEPEPPSATGDRRAAKKPRLKIVK